MSWSSLKKKGGKDGTQVDKRSKEFKDVQKRLLSRQRNASKLEDEFNKFKAKRVEAQKELQKQEKKRLRGEKTSTLRRGEMKHPIN